MCFADALFHELATHHDGAAVRGLSAGSPCARAEVCDVCAKARTEEPLKRPRMAAPRRACPPASGDTRRRARPAHRAQAASTARHDLFMSFSRDGARHGSLTVRCQPWVAAPPAPAPVHACAASAHPAMPRRTCRRRTARNGPTKLEHQRRKGP